MKIIGKDFKGYRFFMGVFRRLPKDYRKLPGKLMIFTDREQAIILCPDFADEPEVAAFLPTTDHILIFAYKIKADDPADQAAMVIAAIFHELRHLWQKYNLLAWKELYKQYKTFDSIGTNYQYQELEVDANNFMQEMMNKFVLD